MDIDITIKNYRCFPDTHPARICLRPGFAALVGVNNSGKSSLLKFFFEFRSLFESFGRLNGLDLANSFKGVARAFNLPRSVSDANDIFCNSNGRGIEIEVRVKSTGQAPPFTPELIVIKLGRGQPAYTTSLSVGIPDINPQEFNPHGPHFIREARKGVVIDLRGYQDALQLLSRMLYIGPFRNAINIGTNDNYFDIRVGQSFIQAWGEWKSGGKKSENEAAYRLTEDIQSIFGFEDLEINPAPDDRTLQVFINRRSYALSELGSGLAQFILVLANAAIRKPSYILIDEPELNLHPSLQLDFLTTLASYAEHGIVFGTHSVGLARASSDRIYALRKLAEGESQVSDFDGVRSLAEFLGEMSFSGYNELGFNKVLLAEGSTDVRTVQQFLRARKLDHQIVLLPLGGSQLINADREPELIEIRRISEEVVALIDSERRSADGALEAPRQAFVDSCDRAGIPCHVLERRAIENYLPDLAVKRVKGDKYRALAPYEKLSDADPKWSKSENWRIAREMSRGDLDGTDLGAFLDSLVPG